MPSTMSQYKRDVKNEPWYLLKYPNAGGGKEPWPTVGADSPYRCQAKAWTTGTRCKRWALKGKKYCARHGGRNSPIHRNYRLPRFYSQAFGPRLKDAIDSALSEPNHKVLSLYEELAVARVVANESLSMCGGVFELVGKKIKKKDGTYTEISDDAKMAAIQAAREALDHVARIVDTTARIEERAKDKVSLATLDLLVSQITRVVAEECGTGNEELAERIIAGIEKKVRLPSHPSAAQSYDVSVNTAVLNGSLGPITEAMDEVTASSSSDEAVEQQGEIQDSPSGETFGED